MCIRDSSIIELLVVIVIIIVIVVIAYPQISNYLTDREVKKEVYRLVDYIKKKKAETDSGKYAMTRLWISDKPASGKSQDWQMSNEEWNRQMANGQLRKRMCPNPKSQYTNTNSSDIFEWSSKVTSSRKHLCIDREGIISTDGEDQRGIENLVIDNKPRFIIGSSLGGFYSTYFAEKFNLKSILLNPAVLPANGMKIYLGENENYSTGEIFEFTNQDVQVLKKFESKIKQISLPENHFVFLESGDEVLNYLDAVNYYHGSSINIFFGGNHSLEMFEDNMHQVIKILQS